MTSPRFCGPATAERLPAAAFEVLAPVCSSVTTDWSHPVHRRTDAALRYLAARGSAAPQRPISADEVYEFGRQPVPRSLATRAGCSMVATASWIGYADLPLGGYLAFPDTADGRPYWLHWKRMALLDQARPMLMKLYVSVPVEHVRTAIRRSIRVLSSMGAASFKVGADTSNLARPDHFVVFVEPEHVVDLAGELAHAIDDLPALGVPFTLPILDDGHVSVAVDPKELRGNGGSRHSWRSYVAHRLEAADGELPAGARELWGSMGLLAPAGSMGPIQESG